MRSWSKALLASYLLILLWLVLFKFSVDFWSVLRDHQSRSLALIPFADLSRSDLRELISNFVAFVPLGLLLSVNFKRVSIPRKLAYMLILSLAAELLQFILAIGVTSITDVIMNALGGFFGLVLYDVSGRSINHHVQDAVIAVVGTILLIAFLFLRFFVLQVRY